MAAFLLGFGNPASAQHWRGGRGGGPASGEARGGHWGGQQPWGREAPPGWGRGDAGERGPGRWG
ncbi:MAG: hypothetical protein ACREEW_03400, partial [Caulobacteraceae bacterium]